MKEKWFIAAKKADFKGIAERFCIDPVTARIIRNRDIVGDEAIRQYLKGSLADLPDPESLKDCGKAAKILRDKILDGKKIRIIGDYDIDGVNASYILWKGLKRCGAQVDCEIPDRMKDGYGLNLSLIQYALEEGIDTILTCDNGISALEQIAYAKVHGMTVIVTDHHEPLFAEESVPEVYEGAEKIREKEKIYLIPRADAVVNPKRPDCPYPYKKLCGAAVAWKVLQVLYRVMGVPEEEGREFLEFVAFATVGDVMDLDGENRILVKEGLKRLPDTENCGLQALMEVNGLQGQEISSYHIGFVLGPCINASGRLDTAKRSLRLLQCREKKEALKLARCLKELNDERKGMTQEAVEAACAAIEEQGLIHDRVLVIYLPDCHESIAGIVAGRIREKYYKPVFVVTDGKEGAKGSGRSIEAYSMFEEMVKCGELFDKFGGHPMAAGFSLKRERIQEMRRRLNESCSLTDADLIPKVLIDVPMPFHYITESLIQELSILEPFGKGNEKPQFAQKNVRLLRAKRIGKNGNVTKFLAAGEEGTVLPALYFGDAEQLAEDLETVYGPLEVRKLYQGMENRITLSVIYYPSVNEYQGRRSIQIVIKNYQVQKS